MDEKSMIINNLRACLGCGNPLSHKQLDRRSSAKFCSRACSRKYSNLKDYKRKYNEEFINDRKLLGYFVGFWVADGHINKRGAVSLASSDKQLIDDFILATGYFGAVSIRKMTDHKNPSSFKSNYPQYNIRYTGTIAKYIQKIGYPPQAKTGKEFLPEAIDDEMFPHFLRGYIDGDGTIGHNISQMKLGYPKYLNVSMVSASKKLLVSIFHRLKRIGIVRGRPHPSHPKRRLYRLGFGHSDAARICRYIYADAPIKLERKYQKYLECKDVVLEHELQAGPCTHFGCKRLAVIKGLCKTHFDIVYHQAHKNDPEVREANKQAVRRYRANHHKSLLKQRRELYAENPEKYRQTAKGYRTRHSGKVKVAKQKYRKEHRDEINEYKRNDRKAKPDLYKAMDRRKYLKKLGKQLVQSGILPQNAKI